MGMRDLKRIPPEWGRRISGIIDFVENRKWHPEFCCEGTTGARRLVGARPVEQTRAQETQLKNFYSAGGSKGLRPLGLSPPLGERGSPSQIRFGSWEMISTEPDYRLHKSRPPSAACL